MGRQILFKQRVVKLTVVPQVLGAVMMLGLAAGQANAATIHWTLYDGAFNDGGTVAGSFLWDTDLQTVTSWNFVVAGGNVELQRRTIRPTSADISSPPAVPFPLHRSSRA